MFKILGFLALAISPVGSPDPFAQVNNLQGVPVIESVMLSQTNISITSINLIAREEKKPPLGLPTQQNRDIGFASIFVHIENGKEENAKVTITSIEIYDASEGKVQAFNQNPQDIYLKPLENAEVAFHLTNKSGYVGQDKVKAVITYQLGKQVHLVESSLVEVDRG